MKSTTQPMPSTRIYAGRYEVLGTSSHCEILQKQFVSVYVWALYSGGTFVQSFATKREALQHCQENPEL